MAIRGVAPIGEAVRDLFWPRRCCGCGLRGVWLCDECRADLPIWTAPWCRRCGVPTSLPCHCGELDRAISAARALGPHEGWLQRGVQLLKYRDELARAEQFGEPLSAAIADLPAPDLIVPVPLHRRRELERGYNQARLIAESMSQVAGVEVASPNAVVRSVDTPHQTGLPAAQRRRNLDGAFTVADPGVIRGKRILIVDDVMTSGATLATLARMLRGAGAATVTAATISRAINIRS